MAAITNFKHLKGNKVAVLHLNKRGGGVIVNTASVAGFLTHGYVFKRILAVMTTFSHRF